MSIEATVVIDFGEEVDSGGYLALIELDDISNSNETSFGPLDQPVIAAHFSTNVIINSIVPTDGNISPLERVSRNNTSTSSFVSRTPGEESKYRLPVVPSSVSVEYAGRQGVTSESSDTIGGIVEYIGNITATPFLANYSFDYNTNLYRLTPPALSLGPDETYEILIVFYLTLVK